MCNNATTIGRNDDLVHYGIRVIFENSLLLFRDDIPDPYRFIVGDGGNALPSGKMAMSRMVEVCPSKDENPESGEESNPDGTIVVRTDNGTSVWRPLNLIN